jgi:hypothetical protein
MTVETEIPRAIFAKFLSAIGDQRLDDARSLLR